MGRLALNLDIHGQRAARPVIYASESDAASQVLGEGIRDAGGAGVIFDSLRHASGINIVAHRPRNVLEVTQTDHYGLTIQAGGLFVGLDVSLAETSLCHVDADEIIRDDEVGVTAL